MIILLHSSKTMTISKTEMVKLNKPELLAKTEKLANYIKSLTSAQLAKTMKLSPALAKKTHDIYAAWNSDSKLQSVAIDSFIGDIYSGLQAPTFSESDRQYADKTLRILSGLYGIIRPLDGIYPYRLEMGYKLPDEPFNNLYDYWGKSVAETLPEKVPVINLTSEEFADVVTPFIDKKRIIAPKFLTVSPKTGEPTFVVIHAKIARGAFAHWMIKTRTDTVDGLKNFDELEYKFNAKLSTPEVPVYICEEFGGKGLSMKKLK